MLTDDNPNLPALERAGVDGPPRDVKGVGPARISASHGPVEMEAEGRQFHIA